MYEENKSMSEKFPSNSYTEIRPIEESSLMREKNDKNPEKKKVRAKEHRKTFGERISENFMNFDRDQIKDRLIFDWLLPEIISTVDDILRMIFFGDRNGGGRRSRREKRDGYVSYNSIYDGKRRDRDDNRPDPTRQNFKRIRLQYYTKEDAEDVLDDLRESLAESESGWVSVKELYSLSDLPTHSVMWKWGWNDLEDCIIERQGEDYVLIMPKAEVIR